MPGFFARQFHNKISNMFGALGVPADDALWPWEWKTVFFKRYTTASIIALPPPLPLESTLERVFKERRSIREFDTSKFLTLSELSTLLYYGAGIDRASLGEPVDLNRTRRFYPSGGARYPLEVYCCLRRIEGVAPGLYHYNVLDHTLEGVGGKHEVNEFVLALGYPWSRDAAALMLMTAAWDRTLSKYKDFGYKIVLLEIGHAAQNMLLAAADLGVGACVLAGFDASRIVNLLDLEMLEEAPVHLCAFG